MLEKNRGQLSEQVVSGGLSSLIDYAVGIFPCTCDTFRQVPIGRGLVTRHCLNCHMEAVVLAPRAAEIPEAYIRTIKGMYIQLFSLEDVSRAVAFGVVPTIEVSDDPVVAFG